MSSFNDPKHHVDGDITDDLTGKWLHCKGGIRAVSFHNKFEQLTSSYDVSGAFTWEGSNDPRCERDNNEGTSTADARALTVSTVHGSDPAGTAGQLIAILENPPLYVRQVFTHSSGTDGKLQTYVEGK